MKNIILQIFLLVSIFSFAQMGIGTNTPDKNSSLDVTATNKGMLVPRIALTNNTDIVTIPNPAKGMYIYNTVDAGAGLNAVVKDNFYYWNGINWEQLVNQNTFKRSIDELRIPRLAGYVYKWIANRYYAPTGDMIVAFSDQPTLANYSFGESMGFNPADPTFSSLVINTTGTYGIEGFVFLLMSTTRPSYDAVLHPEVCLQKSTDGGATYVDTQFISTAEYSPVLAGGLTIPINFTGALRLNKGDLLRMVVRIKFPSGGPSYADIVYLSIERSDALGVKYSAGIKAVLYPDAPL